MSNNEDVAWRFGTRVDKGGKKVKCLFCGKVMSGGITRLKEHLGHVSGNVTSCGSVSAEVRKEMKAILTQYKAAKIDKQKRVQEFEEEVLGGYRGNDDETVEDDDDEEDDRQMMYARQESRMQHENDYRRQFRQTTFGEGASQNSQLRRSGSVQETGMRGVSKFENASTPESRLRSRVIELEKDNPKKKQSKISTGWMKKAKKQLVKAWGNFIIDTNIPFRAVESPYANPLMQTIREVGDGLRAPSAYDISEVYLPEGYNEMKEYIKTLGSIWDDRGVTVMCDGWTGPTNMHIINFLIYSVRGTIFHKSIDASDVARKDGNYYFKLMKDVVEEIGPHRVVHIVTDNEASVKSGGKKLMEAYPHLYWTTCVAHCLDLLLEDLCKRKSFNGVIEKAKKVTRFIYHYKWVSNYMKKFTNGKELLRPGLTRFATNFIMLESVVKQKIQLQDMFNSAGWLSTRYCAIDETAIEIRELFSRSPSACVTKFWEQADEILRVQAPIVKVLRLVDGDAQPTMGFIYEAMERCKLAIEDTCANYKQYWNLIDKRWDFQLHQDLHAAGCYFNPQFLYGDNNITTDKEIKSGTMKVIRKMEQNIDNQIRASNEIFLYENKMESFASTAAERAIKLMDPATWWLTYGDSASHLQRIAVRVLSQTTSSSNCERNWSMWSLVHTKTRNRLKYKKLHKIVYLRYNMWLKRKQQTRRSQNEIHSGFDPINLDNIFDCNDPLNTWLEVEEDPFCNGEDLSWMDVDDENENVGDQRNDRVVEPIFSYHSNKVSSTRESVLSLTSSDDGNDDNDGGNNDGYTGYEERSQNDDDAYLDRPPGFPRQTVPLTTPHQMHERARKGKHAACSQPNNESSWQGRFENTVINELSDSSIDTYYPYNRNFYPNTDELSSGYESTSNTQGVQIFNHGNISYGDTHYRNPSYYGSDTNSNTNWHHRNSNTNEATWGFSDGSSIFGNQNQDQYRQYEGQQHEEQQPARRSFWM